MNEFIKAGVFTGFVLLVATALSYAGRDDLAEQHAESKEYCFNVQIWKDTKGLYGHPAYRGQQECKGKHE